MDKACTLHFLEPALAGLLPASPASAELALLPLQSHEGLWLFPEHVVTFLPASVPLHILSFRHRKYLSPYLCDYQVCLAQWLSDFNVHQTQLSHF